MLVFLEVPALSVPFDVKKTSCAKTRIHKINDQTQTTLNINHWRQHFIHFYVTPFLCLQFRAAQVCSWKPFFQRTDTLFVCSNWFMYHEIMIFQMHALTDPCEFFPRTNITPLTLSTDCKSHAVLKSMFF